LRTEEGWLDFQDYFVRRRCAPRVREIAYDGAASARAHPDVLAALRERRLRAIVICPSNPFLSIEPILAVAGRREAVWRRGAPGVAGRGGIADHRRTRRQGANRQDDDRTRPRGQRGGRGAALPRLARWLCARSRRCRRGGKAWHSSHAGAHPHDDACRSRRAGAALARQRRRLGKGQGMNAREVYAVLPIKDTDDAKQRLAGVLSAPRRQELALAMFEDVLATLGRVREFAGIFVVTADSSAVAIASRYGAGV